MAGTTRLWRIRKFFLGRGSKFFDAETPKIIGKFAFTTDEAAQDTQKGYICPPKHKEVYQVGSEYL